MAAKPTNTCKKVTIHYYNTIIIVHLTCINNTEHMQNAGAQTRASDPNNFRPPPFGQGSGPIFWDDVGCTGSEQRLEECPHLTTPEGSYDCIHDEDVGVTCQPPQQPPETTSKFQPFSTVMDNV